MVVRVLRGQVDRSAGGSDLHYFYRETETEQSLERCADREYEHVAGLQRLGRQGEVRRCGPCQFSPACPGRLAYWGAQCAPPDAGGPLDSRMAAELSKLEGLADSGCLHGHRPPQRSFP